MRFAGPRYRGSLRAGLSRLAGAVAVMALALPAGGCSFSWQLDALFSKTEPAAAVTETTGSVKQADALPASDLPPNLDLVYAKAAAADVLTRGGKDSSQVWENPRTGARGTVTPIASVYSDAGLTCRDFLASYVQNGSSSWMQGEACRMHQGKWEVRTLKPWRRS